MYARVVAAVALLAVTAGCSGLGQFGAAEDAGPRTVNPALQGTPTATPEPTVRPTPAGGFPPGVTRDGVDADRLVDAHRRALSNGSFTSVRVRTIAHPNGRRIVNESLRARVGAGNDHERRLFVRRTRWGTEQARTTTYWTNGSVTVRREEGNASVRAVVTAGRPDVDDPAGAERVRTLFDLLDPRFAGTVDEGGRRLAALEARTDRIDREGFVELHDVELRLLVAPDGAVTSYRLVYRTTRFDGEVLVVDRFRVTDVGTTTVGRPGWASEALAGERNATDDTGGTNGTAEGGTATTAGPATTTANGYGPTLSSSRAGRTPRAPGRTAGRG